MKNRCLSLEFIVVLISTLCCTPALFAQGGKASKAKPTTSIASSVSPNKNAKNDSAIYGTYLTQDGRLRLGRDGKFSHLNSKEALTLQGTFKVFENTVNLISNTGKKFQLAIINNKVYPELSEGGGCTSFPIFKVKDGFNIYFKNAHTNLEMKDDGTFIYKYALRYYTQEKKWAIIMWGEGPYFEKYLNKHILQSPDRVFIRNGNNPSNMPKPQVVPGRYRTIPKCHVGQCFELKSLEGDVAEIHGIIDSIGLQPVTPDLVEAFGGSLLIRDCQDDETMAREKIPGSVEESGPIESVPTTANSNNVEAPSLEEQAPGIAFISERFQDKRLSSAWAVGGRSVELSAGVLKVLAQKTDGGGYARLAFDLPPSPITIARKALIHYGNDKAMPKLTLTYKDSSGAEHFIFTICYGNLQYQDATNRQVIGTFLAPGDSNPLSAATRNLTTAGPAVIWDNWFSERIVYDSTLGLVRYQREGTEAIIARTPKLPAGTRVALGIDAWGWWTGHSHSTSDLVVSAPSH